MPLDSSISVFLHQSEEYETTDILGLYTELSEHERVLVILSEK